MFERYGLDAVIGRREGIRFWDAFDERSWINCHCNGGVFNLGHRNPDVVRAVMDALSSSDLGNHHLPAPGRAELARRLSATTGDRLSGVVFGVSGGEAIDVAIKAARYATGRIGIISAMGGYHGHTGLALAAGDPQFRDPFGPNPPGFAQVPFDDLAAMGQPLVTAPPRSSSSPCRRLSGCPCRATTTCPVSRRSAGSGALCSSSTRCRPGWDAPEGCGPTNIGSWSPTWLSPLRPSAAASIRSPPLS